MNATLQSIPCKEKRISTPGFTGMDYPDAVKLYRESARQDARFAEYVLKPATDEMWNLINKERTIEEIIEYALLEFGLRIEPETFLPVFAGWYKAGLLSIQVHEKEETK